MTMAEKLSPGMSVTQARRLLAGLLREDGIESADLDARLLIGAALAVDHATLASEPDRTLSDDDAKTLSRIGNAPPQSRTDGPHSRPPGILEPAVPAFAGHAGAASGNRNRRRSRARCRPRSPKRRAAHRRSRHRIRRDPARLAQRIAERVRHRNRSQRGRAGDRARQCRRSATFAARGFRGLRLFGGARAVPSISSCPIRPISRAPTSTHLQIEVQASRSAPRARWRRGRS